MDTGEERNGERGTGNGQVVFMSLPKAILDLKLVKECRRLIIIIYKLTNLLPDNEKFGLISQMRRAVVSVLLNIVEGYGRVTKKDRLHFYNISRGSFRELECQILILFDLKFINKEQFDYVCKEKDKVGGLLTNFIKSQS